MVGIHAWSHGWHVKGTWDASGDVGLAWGRMGRGRGKWVTWARVVVSGGHMGPSGVAAAC